MTVHDFSYKLVIRVDNLQMCLIFSVSAKALDRVKVKGKQGMDGEKGWTTVEKKDEK